MINYIVHSRTFSENTVSNKHSKISIFKYVLMKLFVTAINGWIQVSLSHYTLQELKLYSFVIQHFTFGQTGPNYKPLSI